MEVRDRNGSEQTEDPGILKLFLKARPRRLDGARRYLTIDGAYAGEGVLLNNSIVEQLILITPTGGTEPYRPIKRRILPSLCLITFVPVRINQRFPQLSWVGFNQLVDR